MSGKPVVILGVFVADTAYRADRQPRMGETILGNSFKLGPGGKGSNQAVAAGKLGADVTFLTRLGVDPFAESRDRRFAVQLAGHGTVAHLRDEQPRGVRPDVDDGDAHWLAGVAAGRPLTHPEARC